MNLRVCLGEVAICPKGNHFSCDRVQCRYLNLMPDGGGCLKLVDEVSQIINEEVERYIQSGASSFEDAPIGDYCPGISADIRITSQGVGDRWT